MQILNQMVNMSYNQLYVTRVHPHILVIMLFYQKLIDNEYKWVLFNDEKLWFVMMPIYKI